MKLKLSGKKENLLQHTWVTLNCRSSTFLGMRVSLYIGQHVCEIYFVGGWINFKQGSWAPDNNDKNLIPNVSLTAKRLRYLGIQLTEDSKCNNPRSYWYVHGSILVRRARSQIFGSGRFIHNSCTQTGRMKHLVLFRLNV